MVRKESTKIAVPWRVCWPDIGLGNRGLAKVELAFHVRFHFGAGRAGWRVFVKGWPLSSGVSCLNSALEEGRRLSRCFNGGESLFKGLNVGT